MDSVNDDAQEKQEPPSECEACPCCARHRERIAELLETIQFVRAAAAAFDGVSSRL